MKFVFITDLHITGVCNVRHGDPIEDITEKLKYVVDYTNAIDGQLLIGGDLFDKSIVSDSVKSHVAPQFTRLKRRALSINGNHDRMYDNDDFQYKTSYNVFVSHGVISDITDTEVMIGDTLVTNKMPLVDRGCKQICLFHGFLNKEDGRNTFHTSDIQAKSDPIRIFLGHDHTVHDVVKMHNFEIHRIGSFFRMDRTAESNRTPQMAVIDSDTMDVTYVPIESRNAEDVFKVRLDTVEDKRELGMSYATLIQHLNGGVTEESTLMDALRQVADDETVRYIEMTLNESGAKIK